MSSIASPKVQRPEHLRSQHLDAKIGSSAELERSSKGAALILLTESQVSQLLQVSLARLRKWRVEKRGPRFIKVGSLVRYRLADLQQWLSSLPTGGDGALLAIDE
jgi:excisionase family DNA binding protein